MISVNFPGLICNLQCTSCAVHEARNYNYFQDHLSLNYLKLGTYHQQKDGAGKR